MASEASLTYFKEGRETEETRLSWRDNSQGAGDSALFSRLFFDYVPQSE
jgi:hypothetical protein